MVHFLYILASVYAYVEEDHVLVLDDVSISEALQEFPQLLIEFYAPWCQFCQAFAPMYSKAAFRLLKEDPPIRIAKIDATANLESSFKYNIEGYPTLLFFIKGEPTEYRGLRTENGVVNWLIKKMSPPAKKIDSKHEFEKYIEKNSISVVLFSKNPQIQAIFEKVARESEGNYFGICENSEIFDEFAVSEPGLAVINSNPLKKSFFSGNFIESEIKKFVDASVMPWLIPYNEKVTQLVFGKQTPCLFVFIPEEENVFYLDILQNVANSVKGSILITYTDLKIASNKRLVEFLGFPPSWMPFAIIWDSESRKFVLEPPLSEAKLLKFFEDFTKNALDQYYKSQSIPTNEYEENVRVLVGKNFQSVVFDTNSDVLVLFYAPWCGHCKKLMPEYVKLAKLFENVKGLVIAKIDATENEAKEFDIQEFPTIKLYPASNKEGISYKGKKDLASLESFLREYSALALKKVEL